MAKADSAGSYIHSTQRVEQERLTHLNEVINPPALAELRLQPGERVLDVGSGLGQFARAAARLVRPRGRVVGIEQSNEQLAEARRSALEAGEADIVDFRQGDALAPPLRDDEWGSFDVT